MQHKPATTRVKIHDMIQARWSPRAFDPDKPVSHDDLLALLEAARWAPSCFNDQPWRFVVNGFMPGNGAGEFDFRFKCVCRIKGGSLKEDCWSFPVNRSTGRCPCQGALGLMPAFTAVASPAASCQIKQAFTLGVDHKKQKNQPLFPRRNG